MSMNKKILFIPALALCATLFACNKGDVTKGDIVYYQVDGGYCVDSLKNMDRTKITSITVPNTINGQPVVEISKGAFKGCISLKEISLPFIGHKADAIGIGGLFGYVFGDEMYEGGGAYTWQCYGLGDRYDDPASDYHEFVIPSSLHKVTVTGGQYICPGAFSQCKFLREINITEGNEATEIGNYAFYNCLSLHHFNIPNKIKTIGRKAFQRCYNLMEVNIPDGVTKIKHNAFSQCISATQASIPSSVTDMGRLVFEDFISGLITTTAKEDQPNWDKEWASDGASIVYDYHNGGLIFSSEAQYALCGEGDNQYLFLVQWIGDWTDPVLTVPSKVTIGSKTYNLLKIGPSVFSENEYITKVIIEDGIEVIGAHAFEKCHLLEQIELPDSLKEIGAGAFYKCDRLGSHIVLDGSKNVRNVIDLKNVEKIDYQAFKDCFATDELSDSVTDHTWYSGLQYVKLGDNLKEIGDSAFEGCELLNGSNIPGDEEQPIFTLPKSVTTVGEKAFYSTFKYDAKNSSTTDTANIIFEHPENGRSSLKNVGENAFALMGVDAKVIELQPEKGYKHYIQINVDLGDFEPANGIITPYMFYASYLGFIDNFPTSEKVTEIGEYAFYYCHGKSVNQSSTTVEHISVINIPVNTIKVGDHAFHYCEYVLFENLLKPASGDSPLTKLTSIGTYSFSDCAYSRFNSLKVPDSVSTIGTYAFSNCNNLLTAELPVNDDFITLANATFSSCTSLGKNDTDWTMIIPASVTTIGSSAFSNCIALRHIECKATFEDGAPRNTITSIGSSAFNKCSSLIDIVYNCELNTTTFGSSVYSGCSALDFSDQDSLYYKNLATIPTSEFASCNSLITFDIASSTTTINESAFSACVGLTTVTGGTALTTINTNAFSGCTALSTFTLADSVSTLGNGAFSNCTALESITLPSSMVLPWTGSKGMGSNVFSGWKWETSGDHPITQTIYFQEVNIVNEERSKIGESDIHTVWGWTLTYHDAGDGEYYYTCPATGSNTVRLHQVEA